MFSSRKPPDTPSVTELSWLSSPQTRILGLVAPHYFDGLGSPMPHGCSQCVKSFPLSFHPFAWCSQSICADRRRTCLCSHRFCSCCWSLSSDGPLKEFRSRDSKLWGPLNATASQYSASCLVSRLQLVPLTTAFLFAPAGDQQSSPVLLQ